MSVGDTLPPPSAPAASAATRFEVRAGSRRIICTVLDDALEAVSGLTVPSTAVLRRRSFDRFRTLINAAAQIKLGKLPPGSTDAIVLSRDDLRRVPAANGMPAFGSAARLQVRPPAVIA